MITGHVAHQMHFWAALPSEFLGHILTDSPPNIGLLYDVQCLYKAVYTQSFQTLYANDHKRCSEEGAKGREGVRNEILSNFSFTNEKFCSPINSLQEPENKIWQQMF